MQLVPHTQFAEPTVTLPAAERSRHDEVSDHARMFAGVRCIVPVEDDEEEHIFTRQLSRPLHSDTALTIPRPFAPNDPGARVGKTLPPRPQLPAPRAQQYTLPPVPVFPKLPELPDLPELELISEPTLQRPSLLPASGLESFERPRVSLPPRPSLPPQIVSALPPAPEPVFEVYDPRAQPSAPRPGHVMPYAPWPAEPAAKSEALITFAQGWGPPPSLRPAVPSVIITNDEVSLRQRVLQLFHSKGDRRHMLLGFAAGLLGMVAVCVVALALKISGDAPVDRRTVAASDDQGFAVVHATVFVDGVARCFELPCTFNMDRNRQWLTIRSANHQAPPARLLESGVGQQSDIHLEMRRVARALPPLPAEFATPQQPAPLALPQSAAAPSVVAEPNPDHNAVASVPYAQPVLTAAPIAANVASPAAKQPVARPAAAPAPKQSRPRAAASASAHLNINSIPASHVVLDGRPLGQTPQLGVRVSAGRHTVVFVKGAKRAVRGVQVAPGGTRVVAARL